MKILIGTPVYDGNVTVDYMMAIRETEISFRSRGIESQVLIPRGSELTRMRNWLVSKFYSDISYTHMLFVDADMGFSARAVNKMIDFGVDFSGCIYPYREIDFQRMHKLGNSLSDHNLARSVSAKYVCLDHCGENAPDGRRVYKMDRGFVKTSAVGCGLMLISRTVISTMIECCEGILSPSSADPYFHDLGSEAKALHCFDQIRIQSGMTLGEDISFCRRWTQECGGSIWGLIDEEITHVGRFKFRGKALDQLKNP